jgi:ANTAR domain.
MGHLNMTEDQAHRYIQKKAMDMRTSPRKVAEQIIKTYDKK